MSLTHKQRGVVKGMMPGALTAVFIVGFASYVNPFGYSDSLSGVGKLNVAIASWVIPAFFIAISIGRLAKHRFFTPEDIDGGGLSAGSEQAKVLQSLLQNTVEQSLLAMPVYAVWSVVMPASCLSTVPAAAFAFAVGRLLFFAGYSQGAPARALGFTLSFYPSLVMLVVILGVMLSRFIS